VADAKGRRYTLHLFDCSNHRPMMSVEISWLGQYCPFPRAILWHANATSAKEIGSSSNGIKLSPNAWCINMLRVSRQELRELVRAVDGGMTAWN
jgi:hypothetical protein